MKINKGDFIEIDFVGRILGSNEIFDLTKENVAKENKIYNPKFPYKPVIICIGEGDVISGLDNKLVGKEKGNYNIEIKSENGFGNKNPGLLKLVPISIFEKENLKPFPGLNVNIDGYMGTIRSVSGGRVIVDFNHLLAGKDLLFEIDIKRIIKEDKEKIESILSKVTNNFHINLEKDKLNLNIKLDEEHKLILKERILKTVPSVKEVIFENIK